MRRKKEPPHKGPLFSGVLTPKERKFVRQEMKRKKARRRRGLLLLGLAAYLYKRLREKDPQ